MRALTAAHVERLNAGNCPFCGGPQLARFAVCASSTCRGVRGWLVELPRQYASDPRPRIRGLA